MIRNRATDTLGIIKSARRLTDARKKRKWIGSEEDMMYEALDDLVCRAGDNGTEWYKRNYEIGRKFFGEKFKCTP